MLSLINIVGFHLNHKIIVHSCNYDDYRGESNWEDREYKVLCNISSKNLRWKSSRDTKKVEFTIK